MNDFNCSTIFLLKHLDIDRNFLHDKQIGFINAYLRDRNRTKPNNELCLYLLFKPTDFASFNYFHELEKERGSNLLEDYDYDGGYVVLVYQLPTRFQRDYERFEKGEYSKFSKEFKKVYTKEMRAFDIVNKTDNMKNYWSDKLGYDFFIDEEIEVWSKPNEENETLDILKIVQYADK